MKRNITDRIKMVKAMEYIARAVNDESVFNYWISVGVADGDIECGDLCGTSDYNMEYYVDDVTFADLMSSFLYLMKNAGKSGGLYCDGVVSGD